MQEESIMLQFPKGIPGFEEYNQFSMTMEQDAPLAHLTVPEDEDCGFLLIQPQALFDEYLSKIDVDEDITSLLEVKEGESVDMWVIVTLGDNVRESTANLKAPLLINMRAKKGVQMIIENDAFASKQPLFH